MTGRVVNYHEPRGVGTGSVLVCVHISTYIHPYIQKKTLSTYYTNNDQTCNTNN